MPKGDKLTDKQELFCKEYVIVLNATQAAIRAGYSEKTARQVGSLNMTKVDILDRIAELRKKTLEKLDISHERIAREYAKIGFSNISDCLDENNNFKNIRDVANSGAISSITIDETTTPTGSKTKKIKFGLWNKKDGLDGLSKHVGFYEQDNKQKATNINVSNLSEEELLSAHNLISKATDKESD